MEFQEWRIRCDTEDCESLLLLLLLLLYAADVVFRRFFVTADRVCATSTSRVDLAPLNMRSRRRRWSIYGFRALSDPLYFHA